MPKVTPITKTTNVSAPRREVTEVIRDIEESVKLQIFTKAKAAKMVSYAQNNQDEVAAMRSQDGMKIAEISNLLSQLV